jgi:hypothetical protein
MNDQKQRTIFIFFAQGAENSMHRALAAIVGIAGALVVEKLVQEDDTEANIALVDHPDRALTVIRETESTKILLFYSPDSSDERRVAEAFASRHPERVQAVAVVGIGGQADAFMALMKLIADEEPAKGEGNEDLTN